MMVELERLNYSQNQIEDDQTTVLTDELSVKSIFIIVRLSKYNL